MTNPRPGGLLFVYGTLRRDVGAPAYALFVKHAALYDDGTITGRLFDLGSYPGGILSDRPEERIYGEVYVLRTPRPTLALLDRYEGVAGTRGNAPALYDRVQVSVATQRHGRLTAWTYVCLLDLAGRPRIEGGDYVRFLRGRPGYRPPSLAD